MSSTQFSGEYRRRVIIDDSDSSDDSDNGCESDSSVEVLTTQSTNNTVTTMPRSTKTVQRKMSIDSISSDSSESIEALFRKASITQKLLSKPMAEVDLTGGYDYMSDEEEEDKKDESESKPASICIEDDPSSAWMKKEQSDEYYLSSEKRPEVSWPNICLPGPLFRQLFSFQRQGVQWMATLHKAGVGGILGDDMGMGKTYVTLSYLGGLLRAGTIRNALVIAPLSVLRSWEKEARNVLRQCVPSVKVTVLDSQLSRNRRLDFIASLNKKKGLKSSSCNLVITTYGLIRSATADFASRSNTIWHYVALDEGHEIKNATTAISKACREICSPDTRRLLLTGTPILNNLKELWALFDFATSGQILGSSKMFTKEYAKDIEAARDRDASDSEILRGKQKNEQLQELIRPYFLQRLKIDFLKDKLPPKRDIVVWTHLSNEQRRRYAEYVESSDSIVRSILTGSVQSPLEGVTWLKKLCGHPLLIEATGEQMKNVLIDKNPEDILRQSAKLQVLVSLVQNLRKSGHRMLIFSQSTKMLDLIGTVLRDHVSIARIDGSTPEKDRQFFVDDFNRDDSRYDAMLLSTKAAGCGLTLIGADTSIIYDPSWTPAEDAQAVDRCYRIGQTKEVTVYRLIAAGTVEEKTYEKQIYKDGIRRAVLSQDQNVQRYFERHELRSLFTLGEPGVCRVMEKFRNMVDLDRYEFVHDLEGVIGLTPHDGFYMRKKDDENSNAAFDGSSRPVPAGPKILGKSQRVMQREMLNTSSRVMQAKENTMDRNVEVLSHNTEVMVFPIDGMSKNKDNSSGPRSGVPNELTVSGNPLTSSSAQGERVECKATTPEAGKTNSTQANSNGSRISCSGTESHEKTLLKLFQSVSVHIEEGRPRKSLEILLDLIESNALEGAQKIEAHRQIAIVAQSLELI